MNGEENKIRDTLGVNEERKQTKSSSCKVASSVDIKRAHSEYVIFL